MSRRGVAREATSPAAAALLVATLALALAGCDTTIDPCAATPMAAPVDAADLTVLEDLHDRILADMGDEDELTAIGFHRNGWIEITVKGRTPQVCAAIHARFGHLVQILPAS